MKELFLGLLFAAASFGADVSGVWHGTFSPQRPDGTFEEGKPAYLMLKQEGNKLTGKAGPSEEESYNMENGAIDGGTVTFELPTGKFTMKVQLKLKDNTLEGEANAESDGQKRHALMKFTKT